MFVIGFVASLVAGALLARNSLFLPGATPDQLRDYYTHSQLAVAVTTVLQIVAAAGLLWFGATFSSLVAAGPRARAGTWLAAGAFVVSSLLGLVLTAVATVIDDSTLVVLARLTLAFGGPVHLAGLAGLLWFGSAAALAGNNGPRWLLRLGLILSPLLLVSLISLALPVVTRVEPLWRLLAAGWLVAVSITGVRAASAARTVTK